MKLDEVVGWYQKKIGTYDKQQWEKTVEQKILDGLGSCVTLKNAKLKTELIDVDLVRGSTFPKAKPKQTLLTVIRLAILRYFFLPLYAQWWVKQTSPKTFTLIFTLYLTQMINWAIYMLNINRLDANVYNQSTTAETAKISNASGTIRATDNIAAASNATYTSVEKHATEEQNVSIAELLIPMALSLLISLIHSQIVATNSATSGNKKRRRFSNTSISGGSKTTREMRQRRRKKLVKIRQPEISETVHASSSTTYPKRVTSNTKPLNTSGSGIELLTKTAANQNQTQCCVDKLCNTQATPSTTGALIASSNSEETFLTITAISSLHKTQQQHSQPRMGNFSTTKKPTLDLKNVSADNMTDNQIKKRNVNWHSPLDSYAPSKTLEKEQQTSPQTNSIATQSSAFSSTSSSAQSSSTSSETTTPTNIDGSRKIPEQHASKIAPAEISLPSIEVVAAPLNDENSTRRNIIEDDGFESLNGKSSSGEDTHSPLLLPNPINPLPALTTTTMTTTTSTSLDNGSQTNQLRLRLNVPAGVEKKTQVRNATSSDETDEEGDDCDIISSPASTCNNECTTSATEWLGITTNSEDCCSYSSDLEHSDAYKHQMHTDEEGCELDFTPTTILNPHGSTDRISCTIWEQRDIKKAQMSVLEISSCIIERVESMPETNDYIYIGLGFSFLLSLIPTFCRLCEVTLDSDKTGEVSYFELPMLLWEKASFSVFPLFRFAFGNTQWERTVLIIAIIQRLFLTLILFIIFAVAERTFKQRFLYAKLFSHLTSSRRARKSNLPHFRLNKVRNIKTWLSVRSYLKKRGPQRSVDIIVSAAFIVTLLLLAFLSVEWLKDSVHLHSHLNLEALMWSITIGIFLLRFMTLGNKIHEKYRSVSVLITEQINLYLQIEQKPKKKDELMVSNSVLKLAADLLKELETPFKISGLSANPYLFTTVKVVILSALSGVLSEVLGFKLKLHKIKIK